MIKESGSNHAKGGGLQVLNMVGGHGNGDKWHMALACMHFVYTWVWLMVTWVFGCLRLGSSGILVHMDGCDGLNQLKSKLFYGQMVMFVAIAPPFPIVIAYKSQ